MKKRNKKYNPYNASHRTAKAVLRNVGMLYVLGEDPTPINLRTYKTMTLDQVLFKSLTGFKHKWSVFIAVFGLDGFGKHYMKSELIQTSEPYYNDELVDVLNVHHHRLYKEANTQQVISMGWLAVPNVIDWNEEEIFKLFERNGALNYTRDDQGNFIQL